MAAATPDSSDRMMKKIKSWLPQGQPLPYEVWNARHRWFLFVVWINAAGLALFGILRGYGVVHSILEGGVVALLGLIAVLVHGRTAKSLAVTTALMSASGILVHLSGGTIEAHFHFFVMVSLITLYQAWAPFLVAIAYVVLHHGVVGTIEPESVYNHPAAIRQPFTWAAIHGLFVLGASIAGLIVWKRNEELRMREQTQVLELNDTVVQGLVAARMSLQLGAPTTETDHLIKGTLEQAKAIVSRSLGNSLGSKEWQAGDFVRQEDATIRAEASTSS